MKSADNLFDKHRRSRTLENFLFDPLTCRLMKLVSSRTSALPPPHDVLRPRQGMRFADRHKFGAGVEFVILAQGIVQIEGGGQLHAQPPTAGGGKNRGAGR